MTVERVFLDTSALFAAVLSETGGARQLLKLGEAGVIALWVGPTVLAEIDAVLARKSPASKTRLALLLDRAGVRPVAIAQPTAAEIEAAGAERVTSLDTALPRADFVSLHCPKTPETVNLIGAPELQLMKPTAYLVNAARGDILVEKDLAEALKSGKIAGAGVDVYDPEPPKPDNPLFALENVILSPHNAALTLECMTRMALHAAMGIDDVLQGRRPKWPVNEPKPRK